MRITDVRLYLLRETGMGVTRFRDGLPSLPDTRDDLWIEVTTDEGVSGWSPLEFWGPVGAVVFERGLRDLAIGADPLVKEALWHRVWEYDRIEELPIYALGALDVALWDITAKVAGLPLWQVIGGYRERIPAYASTATFDSVEEFLDVADQCLELGFRAIKLHAWGDARRDAALCGRLREHVGPEIELMYDGSAAFDLYDSLRLGRALEEAGYLWYEEPMREFALGSYRQLADALDIPILGAETTDGCHYNAAEWLATGAADMVRMGTHFKGGITGSLRIAHLADAFGRTAEVHGGGLPNIHLCCAVRNTTYYESMVLTNPVQREEGVDADGTIGPPPGPGIGFEVDARDLAARAVAVR